MEICQHCGMYMKPFMPLKVKEGAEATCEFCSKPIAEIIKKKDSKLYWEKVKVLTPHKI